MFASRGTNFLRKDAVTNFGRTEHITGAAWTTMVDVDIDEQQSWTLTVDTKTIKAVPLDAVHFAIGSKVMAKVEIGSGNGTSVQIIDASDLAQMTISGDHVKVALTLASATAFAAPPNGTSYGGYGDPAPAPATDAALVSCFLSSEFIVVTPPGADYPVVPVFGAPGGLSSLGTVALVSQVPVRVRRYSAFNPAVSGTVYLNLRSSGQPTEGNNPATLLSTVPLPANVPVFNQFATGMPFARGLSWDVTNNPDGTGASLQTVRVDLELVRKPSVVLATSIQPTS